MNAYTQSNKTTLVQWFQVHGQINDVRYESDFDFNGEKNLTYPAVNIEYTGSNTSGKVLNNNYTITIGDLVDLSITGQEDEIMSDCMLIAEDFLAWLQEQEGMIFDQSSQMQPFFSDTHDLVSGIVLLLTISTIRSQSPCATPSRLI